MVVDLDLKERITAALLADDRLAEQPINIAIADGEVTLTGCVQSHRRKLIAHEIAASFDGCRGVRNELQVEPPGPLSDDEIADAVRAALDAHADITKEVINVSSKGGHVTLFGHIGSHWERLLAEDIALASRGVRSVNNLIVVNLMREIEDEALSHSIQQALSYSRGLADADINVAVVGDLATLSGVVTHLWQKETAEHVVRRFRVRMVKNDIHVVL